MELEADLEAIQELDSDLSRVVDVIIQNVQDWKG